MFSNAKWIWRTKEPSIDEYVEFFKEFTWSTGETVCRLSCDSDYTLYINGKVIASNQYGDFEHYKSYDEIDVTPFLKKGANTLAVLVWHFGESSQRYYLAQAGLIFEVWNGNTCLAFSDENTLCRQSKAYKSDYKKIMTTQLGFSFLYDARKEDDWTISGRDCVFATVVQKNCEFVPRPNQKLRLLDRVQSEIMRQDGTYFLIDLKKETVGLAVLEFTSETEQKIRVDFGEDLQDGHVRRRIGNRDFSFEYVAKKGDNAYINYMLRLGCRYLEIYAENPIKLQYAGLIPQVYPVTPKVVRLQNALDQRIYDMCVETLKLCMMEHYVDCPWREQCLYAFDSRNQMLCGYYAFEGGNFEYARSNLQLFSKDRRKDELLSICSPCSVDLTIPSFSLYYLIAVREYLDYAQDIDFVKSVYSKLISILQVFLRKRENGLVYKFESNNHWNFYDWSPYLNGNLGGTEKAEPDLIINCLFILALNSLRQICQKTGEVFCYEEILAETKKEAKKAFFCDKNGYFALTVQGEEYTELGNAFAILAGLTDEAENKTIASGLVNGEFHACSLSMKTWIYDALLQVNEEKYKDFILDEIRTNYKKMLDAGATSAWETIDGASAFGNAGSLCHGWTAIPIYYYHKFFYAI